MSLRKLTVAPSDFPSLAKLCHRDTEFPTDLAGWHDLLAHQCDGQPRNSSAEPLRLDVQLFADWSTRLKIAPCIDALRAFVIIERRKLA